MRETPELRHDVPVLAREIDKARQVLVVRRAGHHPQGLHTVDRIVLQAQRFGVGQRHGQKHTTGQRQHLVPAAREGVTRERLGACVAGKGGCLAAKYVASELVEQYHQCQSVQCARLPVGQSACGRVTHQMAKARIDVLVQLGATAKPQPTEVLGRPARLQPVPKPELQHGMGIRTRRLSGGNMHGDQVPTPRYIALNRYA